MQDLRMCVSLRKGIGCGVTKQKKKSRPAASVPSFLSLGAQTASGSHELGASPAGVSDASPRGGYVDIRGSWYMYGQVRASTRITGSPRITDQLRISHRITVRIATETGCSAV